MTTRASLNKWKITGLLVALLVIGWVLVGLRQYEPPKQRELRKRVAYLERVIQEGTGPGTELAAIGQQNPEWALLSLSFSAYAFTNLAAQQPAFKAEAVHYIDLAVEQALTLPVRGSFEAGATAGTTPDTTGSVLYLGHLNLMLGCLRKLDPASPRTKLHNTLSRALFRRYSQEPSGCLESYPKLRWVPDNTVALASLALHSQLTGSGYVAASRRWVIRAQRQYLNARTGVLASQVDAQGQPQEEPRGSMVGWSIWFLSRFDPAFARDQYERYEHHFSTNLGLVRLYRERAGQYTTSYGDLDSGPLVLGYSIPANAFAFADAVAVGDLRNARRLQRLIQLGRREIETPIELQYGVRFVDLSVSPLAEALLLYAEFTVTPHSSVR
jgi:hypothetical protein